MSSITAKQYVTSKVKGTALAGYENRIFGSLVVANISRNTVVTADVENAIDALFRKLSAKLSKSTTALPGSHVQARPESERTSIKDSEIKKSTYASSLRREIDPQTGDKLHVIKLLGNVDALHNPSTRVVYPIPGSKDAIPEFV
jgi:hypothetical protein